MVQHHTANLRLQMRYFNIENPDNDPESDPLSIRFSVIFAVGQEERWRNFELERIGSSGVAPQCQLQLIVTDQIISCFCSRIHTAKEAYCCLGIIVSSNARRHRVWVPKNPLSIPSRGRAMTLASMLHDLKPEVAPTLEERLKLGVRLASSVLQLHDTEWLNERWSKQEIWFIQEEPCQNPVLRYPLVRRAFQPGEEIEAPPGTPIGALVGPWNTSLFALGITLIELWDWKSLEVKDIGEAWRCFLGLKGRAPASFIDVVRRCFSNLDHTETQLHLDDFKNTVYLKIVLPLEDTLKWFCGKDNIGQIFEEYSA